MPFNNHYQYLVNKVRLVKENPSESDVYENNVFIAVSCHPSRKTKYLQIIADNKCVFLQDFSELQWIERSSTNGVSTICSPLTTAVITYDKENLSVVDFFNDIQNALTDQSTVKSCHSEIRTMSQDQIQMKIDQLLHSISSGDTQLAESITRELADSQINIELNLVNKPTSQNHHMHLAKPDNIMIESPHSILRLTVRIERFANDDLIEFSINVPSGTALRSVKAQIEEETGIKSTNQHWFAFERYPISDDYIFGSSTSLISNENQRLTSSRNFIRSGEKLVLYIAQESFI